jgi:3-isopropylmalate/(R)-2-methylmalate dehydratase small subunit
MDKLRIHRGVAAPLLRINIDTDAIIPSREMKQVSKTGLGEGLFAGWRYIEPSGRTLNPDFILNQSNFTKATILLAGVNFGCGSSREHAVWALKEYGFRVLIAPSFGAIFYNNCIRNGLLPVVLSEAVIGKLADTQTPAALTVDLERCVLVAPDGMEYPFEIQAEARDMLLDGLDPVALTLKLDDRILAFQQRDRTERPWIYLPATGMHQVPKGSALPFSDNN